jgi:hypothetical protein
MALGSAKIGLPLAESRRALDEVALDAASFYDRQPCYNELPRSC